MTARKVCGGEHLETWNLALDDFAENTGCGGHGWMIAVVGA